MTTPTPYKMIIAQPGTMHQIVSNDGEYLCSLLGNKTDEQKQADTAFILTACNSHAALVQALEALVNCPDYKNIKTYEMAFARAALRMAQG